MTTLQWDEVSKRYYEAGIDRGVLYLGSGRGVPWNGLTGVEESFDGDASESSYFDGVKNRDSASFGDYAGTLRAFTYPDEFLEFEGVVDLGGGLYVDDQAPKPFNLTYRTRVGNDVDGPTHGYKIHILYNLTVVPDPKNYETHSDSRAPLEFSWSLTSVPQDVTQNRPTAHVILDSRLLNTSMLRGLESVLYGTNTTEARLPDINELIDFITAWDPKVIDPRSNGIAILTNAIGDLTASVISGLYYALPTTRLVETEVKGLFRWTGQLTPDPEPVDFIDGGSPGSPMDVLYDGGSPNTEHENLFDGGNYEDLEALTGVVAGGPSKINKDVYKAGSPSQSNTTTITGGAP